MMFPETSCKKLSKANMEIPETNKVFAERMKLVRRDIGNLLFHFTRTPDEDMYPEIATSDRNALTLLRKIVEGGRLVGSAKWITNKSKCICFTEAPIHEFTALFSLVTLAADKKERPRYQPYGIAVKRDWLYEKGGRPVIYDNKQSYDLLPEPLKYRHVLFEPQNGIDCTWEREWRICTDELSLEPNNTLIIVPDAATAFEITYAYAEETIATYSEGAISAQSGFGPTEGATGGEGTQGPMLIRKPKWMAVSLDLFDIKLVS